MARETSFLNITFPSALEEPWQESIDAYFADMDVNMFSAVTDRNVLITGGGTFLFDSATDTLSWTDPIKITNFVTGFFQEIPAGDAILLPGEFLGTTLVRGLEEITGVIELEKFTAAKLLDVSPRQEFHLKLVICFRFGDNIIFRNGRILPPDTPLPILEDPLLSLRAFIYSEFLKTQFLNQFLIGDTDGTRTDFYVCRNAVPQLFAVYLDGMRMNHGTDFEWFMPRRVRFATPPDPGATLVYDMYEVGVDFQGVFAEANIWGEIPSGDVDGVNDLFTICLAHKSGTLRVYLDGLRMIPGVDFNIVDSQTFQFTTVPSIGMTISVDYVIDRMGVDDFLPFFVFNEVPTQNSPTEFQTANNYEPETVQVYKNGMRMKLGVDYVETLPNLLTFVFSVDAVLDKVIVDYGKALT